MKITAVKRKNEGRVENFKAAIKSLRNTLDLSQEEMAARIGSTYASYRQWESGRSIPGGKWLIRILRLCPNGETRAAFGFESEISNLQSPPGPETRPPLPDDLGPSPLTRHQRADLRTEAHDCIDELFEVAAPDEIIKKVIASLRQSRGHWVRLRDAEELRKRR